MNPAPDADLHSVGPENFDWIVEAVAELAIERAKTAPQTPTLQAEVFLKGSSATKTAKPRAKKDHSRKKAGLAKTGKVGLRNTPAN